MADKSAEREQPKPVRHESSWFTFGNVATALGLVLTVLTLAVAIWVKDLQTEYKLVLLFQTGMALSWLVYAAYQNYCHYRRIRAIARDAQYGKVMGLLLNCASHVKKAQNRIRPPAAASIAQSDLDIARKDLESFLNSFAVAFTTITGTPCRACIKKLVIDLDAPKIDSNNLEVENFCRSETLRGKAAANDINKKHYIRANTDFAAIMDSGNREEYWFSNDLSVLNGYQNSSWPADLTERGTYIRNKNYSYISTIVWPIHELTEDDKFHIVAFLCVDSKEKNVFDPDRDVFFGQAMCEMLFPTINAFNEKEDVLKKALKAAGNPVSGTAPEVPPPAPDLPPPMPVEAPPVPDAAKPPPPSRSAKTQRGSKRNGKNGA